MSSTYEVMYNTCYGGFSFPLEFVKLVFEKYPPHTTVGEQLWRKCSEHEHFIQPGVTPDPSWTYYQEIVAQKPFVEGYNYVFIKTYRKYEETGEFKLGPVGYRPDTTRYISADNASFYFLSEHETGWRDSPEVIALAKEFGLFGPDKQLALDTVPVGYDYDVDEYDGKESIKVLFPYRKVVSELVAALKSGDHGVLGSLSKQLLDGTLDPKTI